MLHSRGEKSSTAELVWTQILQGMGGGISATAYQVAAQASVPHADVAAVTALVLTSADFGGGVGSAVGEPAVFSSFVIYWQIS